MENYQPSQFLTPLLMHEVLGKPLEELTWSPLVQFHPKKINQIPDALCGVYLIRYKDNPRALNPASMLYVGSANYCLKRRLNKEYRGEGNPFLPDFVQANPLGVYFQYLYCQGCKRIEAYLLAALDYPLCN
jgi:hypothetical protein